MQEALRLLAGLHQATSHWILTSGTQRTIACDESVADEGTKLNGLIFILDGLFAVRIRGQELPLTLLGPGELVGEISFLENLPATASVVACENSHVLWVTSSDLERHIDADSVFAADLYYALARVLSRRLRERSLALPAGAVNRSADGLKNTDAWNSIVAPLEAFKDLLLRADAATEHGANEVDPTAGDRIQQKFTELVRCLADLTRRISNAETLIEVERALSREFLPYLHLTRFTRRMLTKPRGYAGDFLTIDWMYLNEPGGVAPLGPLLDSLFLNSPAARAVRNRRGLLADQISIALSTGVASVTSLACGPATELFDVFSANPGAKLHATLIDIDFQALAFVAERRDAAGLTKRMRLEHGNLVHLATGRSAVVLKDQNLVYSIGLVDYFEDRFVIALLNWIHGCLLQGGKVILGNFHIRNPDRAFMDLVLDWKLIHRSEDDMNRLFEASSFARPCTEILFEEEGINMFACGTKN